jgi:transposase
MRTIPLKNSTRVAVVDDHHYPWLSRYEWRELRRPKARTGYASASIPTSAGRTATVPMHRLILNLEPGDPRQVWTSPRLVDTRLRVYNHSRRSIMARKRRAYTPEFKAEAVRLVTEQGYAVAEAARSPGIHETLLRSWKQALEAQGDQAFPGHGELPPSEEELRRLRAENRRLRAERDILKKAAALFAREAL